MSHSIYIIILSLTGLAGWGAWLLVVTRLDPTEISTLFAFSLFYLTLFLGVMSTASIASFYIRVWLSRNEVYFEHLNFAIREGVLAAVTVVILLWLQYFRVLTWWDGGLLFITIVLLEIFFITRKKNTPLL